MAGIRDKAAADLLRGLESVGQAVELLGQLGHLVPPGGLEPVAILPLPHHTKGVEQGGDAGGEHF